MVNTSSISQAQSAKRLTDPNSTNKHSNSAKRLDVAMRQIGISQLPTIPQNSETAQPVKLSQIRWKKTTDTGQSKNALIGQLQEAINDSKAATSTQLDKDMFRTSSMSYVSDKGMVVHMTLPEDNGNPIIMGDRDQLLEKFNQDIYSQLSPSQQKVLSVAGTQTLTNIIQSDLAENKGDAYMAFGSPDDKSRTVNIQTLPNGSINIRSTFTFEGKSNLAEQAGVEKQEPFKIDVSMTVPRKGQVKVDHLRVGNPATIKQ